MKKLRDKTDQPQAGASGAGGAADPPLVPTSAELKLLKSSQKRINTQTAIADIARKDGSEDKSELTALLQRAARRQAEVAQTAREIKKRTERRTK